MVPRALIIDGLLHDRGKQIRKRTTRVCAALFRDRYLGQRAHEVGGGCDYIGWYLDIVVCYISHEACERRMKDFDGRGYW